MVLVTDIDCSYNETKSWKKTPILVSSVLAAKNSRQEKRQAIMSHPPTYSNLSWIAIHWNDNDDKNRKNCESQV